MNWRPGNRSPLSQLAARLYALGDKLCSKEEGMSRTYLVLQRRQVTMYLMGREGRGHGPCNRIDDGQCAKCGNQLEEAER